MRVDNIAALSLQNMVNKNRFNNSNNEKSSSGLKISENKNLKTDVLINEKMRSQIRELNEAENRIDSNESFDEAKKVYSDANEILGDMENLFSKLVSKELSKDDVAEQVKILSDKFSEVSKSEYFNSKWLKNRLDPGKIVDMSTDERIEESLLNISSIKEEMEKIGLYSNEAIKEENLNASMSRIHNVNMAEEVITLTKQNMLNESSRAILAQSNKQPEQIMKLLE